MRRQVRLLTLSIAAGFLTLGLAAFPAHAVPIGPGDSGTVPSSATGQSVPPYLLSATVLPLRYPVTPGDTVSSLADQYSTTIQAIVDDNHLVDPNLIVVGQTLLIYPGQYVPNQPVSSTQASPAPVQHYYSAPIHYSPPVQVVSASGVWGCIAQHESGNTNANTGNGYFGYFQFDPRTWASITGLPGLPTAYSYATQLAGAEKLQARAGWGQWPVTSRECGV